MEKYKKQYKTATFSLESDILEELNEFSIESQTKKTTIVEDALRAYIKRYSKTKKGRIYNN